MKDLPFRKKGRPASLVYYGSFREGRHHYFHHYFNDPKVDITISSPSNKFQKAFPHNRITHVAPPEDLLTWLQDFGMGLYLEDKKSHNEYHSPPNRFYEMLSAGLPMIFQREAGATILKAGYEGVDMFSISTNIFTQEKLISTLTFRDIFANDQRKAWHTLAMAERKDLPMLLKKAWAKFK
jgi:hypothetical protein